MKRFIKAPYVTNLLLMVIAWQLSLLLRKDPVQVTFNEVEAEEES